MTPADAPPDTDRTLVIGVGSPLMGDDGLGLKALEELREGYDFVPEVEFLDGGTWGMNLLPFIEEARRVLILDAIHADEPAGAVVELEGDAIPRFFSTKLSPHQIDLREVLALAELRGTLPTIVALGIRPGSIRLEAGIGPEVERGLPLLVDAALRRLASWGHEARRAPSPADGR